MWFQQLEKMVSDEKYKGRVRTMMFGKLQKNIVLHNVVSSTPSETLV